MADKFYSDWFDLAKYEPLKDLDLHGWFVQLFIRSLLTESSNLELIEQIKSKPVFEIQIDPVHDASCSITGREKSKVIQQCKDYSGKPSEYQFNTSSVKSASAEDMWWIKHYNFPIDFMDIDFNMYGESIGSMEQLEFLNTPIDEFLIKGGFSSEHSHVVVDLTATDEQIKNDFNRWLTQYREFKGIKPRKRNFTKNDMEEWVKLKLLAYLDLILIANNENQKITQAEIGKLLYPDVLGEVVDPTERIRKTTRPKAIGLLNQATFNEMKLQIGKAIEGKYFCDNFYWRI